MGYVCTCTYMCSFLTTNYKSITLRWARVARPKLRSKLVVLIILAFYVFFVLLAMATPLRVSGGGSSFPDLPTPNPIPLPPYCKCGQLHHFWKWVTAITLYMLDWKEYTICLALHESSWFRKPMNPFIPYCFAIPSDVLGSSRCSSRCFVGFTTLV